MKDNYARIAKETDTMRTMHSTPLFHVGNFSWGKQRSSRFVRIGRRNSQLLVLASLTFLGSITLPAFPAAALSQSGFNGSNVNIPDSGGFVSSTINISGAPSGATVTSIDVYFKVIHPYSGDLNIDLNADAQGGLGNYDLWEREGGASDNAIRTVTGITTFNGLSVNRTWFLYARDEEAGDTGFIDEWSITVHYNGTSPGAFALSGSPYCNTSPPTAPAVLLNWSASSGVSTYTVYRNGSQYAGPFSSSQLSFDNTAGVTAGQTYTYFIRATNSNGSTDSNTISVSVPANVCGGSSPGAFALSGSPYCNTSPPTAPAVLLNWSASSGVSTYTVYRNGSQYAGPFSSSQLSFDNTAGVTAGQTYTYFIRATNSNGSTDSNTISVSVPANVCGGTSPGAFALSGSPYCNTSPPTAPAVLLNWSASSGVSTYTVYRNGSQYAGPFSSSQLSFDNTAGVTAGQTYTYFIRATNSNGSTDSNTISVFVPANVCDGTSPGNFTLSVYAHCNSLLLTPEVELTWTKSNGADTYQVFRDAQPYSPVLGKAARSFTDTVELYEGETHNYFVRASTAHAFRDTISANVEIPAGVCQAPGGSLRITGKVRWEGDSPMGGVTVLLQGTTTALATTDASGRFRFDSLNPGPYGITPQLLNFTFTPSSTFAVLTTHDQTLPDFVGQQLAPGPPQLEISGPATSYTGHSVTLEAKSLQNCAENPTGWTWALDGGITSSLANVSRIAVSWRTPGTHLVTATNNGCSQVFASHQITISPQPTLTIDYLDPNPSLLEGGDVIPNQAALTQRFLLAPTSSIVGVAADGVTRALVLVTTETSATLTIALESADSDSLGSLRYLGDETDRTSLTVTTAPSGDRYRAFAVYVSPSDFSSGPSAQARTRTVTLGVSARFSGLPPIEASRPLVISRPPVVLVHGLASGPETWQAFGLLSDSRYANGYTFADYSNKKCASLGANSGVLPRQIAQTLNWARTAQDERGRLAITQVDVVAHSLGGLLARAFTSDSSFRGPDNYLAGSIHKLVTLDTPHAGSVLSSILPLDFKIAMCFPTLSYGAFADLEPSSSALRHLGASDVKGHSLIGSWARAGENERCPENSEDAPWCGMIDFLQTSLLLAGDDDGIVTAASQAGGISSEAQTEFFGPYAMHTANTHSADYASQVTQLLTSVGLLSDRFAPFPSPVIEESALATPRVPLLEPLEVLRIISPASGAEIRLGERVHVVAEVLSGILPESISLLTKDTFVSLSSPDFAGDVVLSRGHLGFISMLATARRPDGVVLVSAPIILRVLPTAPVTAIDVSPPGTIELGVGEELPVAVTAQLQDGNHAVITQASAGTEYISDIPEILGVSPDGVLSGNRPGTSRLSIRSGGSVVSRVARVRPGCTTGPGGLCLSASRFRLEASWFDPRTETSGTASPVLLTADTGYFWFFGSSNIEVVAKVLDGCAVNGRFWVFATGLTDVGVELRVIDTYTGEARKYRNEPGNHFVPIFDTNAFPSCTASGGGDEVGAEAVWGDAVSRHPLVLLQRDGASANVSAAFAVPERSSDGGVVAECSLDSTALCLRDGRFRVEMSWRTVDGSVGEAEAVRLTSDAGYFWFFRESNVEAVVKILDGCTVNGRLWVFAGGLTNVATSIRIRDLVTGEAREYHNPQGVSFLPILDTGAFAGCGL